MIFGFVIKTLILIGAICGLGVLGFMWLNAKESSLDDRTYDDDFDIDKQISRQYKQKQPIQKQSSKEQSEKKENPPAEDSAIPQESDSQNSAIDRNLDKQTIDAEIVEKKQND